MYSTTFSPLLWTYICAHAQVAYSLVPNRARWRPGDVGSRCRHWHRLKPPVANSVLFEGEMAPSRPSMAKGNGEVAMGRQRRCCLSKGAVRTLIGGKNAAD